MIYRQNRLGRDRRPMACSEARSNEWVPSTRFHLERRVLCTPGHTSGTVCDACECGAPGCCEIPRGNGGTCSRSCWCPRAATRAQTFTCAPTRTGAVAHAMPTSMITVLSKVRGACSDSDTGGACQIRLGVARASSRTGRVVVSGRPASKEACDAVGSGVGRPGGAREAPCGRHHRPQPAHRPEAATTSRRGCCFERDAYFSWLLRT